MLDRGGSSSGTAAAAVTRKAEEPHDGQESAPLPRRALSQDFGRGASAFSAEDLESWKAAGLQAEAAMKAQNWPEADRLAETLCRLRPDWPKSYELRRRTMTRLKRPQDEVLAMLRAGLRRCEAEGSREDCGALRAAEAALTLQAAAASSPSKDTKAKAGEAPEETSVASPMTAVKFKSKVKGVKLLPHEQTLFEAGELEDITHSGSSAIWLSRPSAPLPDDNGARVLLYRPMGDLEFGHLSESGALPATQPYQTIVKDAEGRVYAEKYLRGQKSVDSSPTTVVEFKVPCALVERLFQMQSKNEDGAISHGLGEKGGRGLPLFNASLQSGETIYRIVFVKRFETRAVGAFGAGRKKVV